MRFLEQPPRCLFFTGKGGVGKTSLACASALHLAARGKRVLLVSTDPASNVGQVFGIPVGPRITEVPASGGVRALEIDPQAAAVAYREGILGPLRGKVPAAELKGVEEQLSGACTTEIAAFDAFAALLVEAGPAAGFDHVLFDTAPTGHTLRLLRLPGAWTGFLEAHSEGASCLGPLAGLHAQRSRYREAVAALADPARTRLVLVARPQRSALAEAERTRRELAEVGLGTPHLVVNGLLPDTAGGDPLAEAIRGRERAALAGMDPGLAALPQERLPLKACDMVGIPALRALLGEGAEPEGAEPPAGAPAPGPSLADLVSALEPSGRGLVMVMGKGGVGKTTVAASLAAVLASRGHRVHLTTTDPAAHLVDTLAGGLEGLTVSRVDPQAETERYRRQVLETKGKGLDEAGRAALAEDLRSPCTEEVAVFHAFSRILRESRAGFVVMDTAPTGHTLLLLDATGAYHREVARKLGPEGHFTTPMTQLQDRDRTRVVLVTLPEATPILEAGILADDLARAGIRPWAWVVNQSLDAAGPSDPLLARRAARERPRVEALRGRLEVPLAVIPMQVLEPVGVPRLLGLAGADRAAAEA